MAYREDDDLKFLEQLKFLEDLDREKQQRERIAVDKYHEGYIKAIYDVRDMFYCSNYEKED